MRRMLIGLTALITLIPGTSGHAQSGTPPQPATDIKSAQIQEAVKRGLAALTPGVSVSDRLISVADLMKHNVAVAVVARPAGPDTRVLSHDKVTEIYYVLRGSGTQATGTVVSGTHQDTSKTIGPGMSSNVPLARATSSRLGPGDIQIIPPGLGHVWTSIDPGGIEYLVFRIDPDHVLEMPK
jgi:oxalate decarboxylase/phosphoglucose isomerase-like protein (cupin superfamily)